MQDSQRGPFLTIMLDRTLSPAIATQHHFTGYRLGAWSPQHVDPLHRCVLATLTMDHRLCIFSRGKAKKWVQVMEPSKLLNDHMAGNDFDTADSHIIQERPKDVTADLWHLKNRTYLLASVTMVWSQVMTLNENKYCLLITAQKSGHIVFWRMSLPLTGDADAMMSSVYVSNQEMPTCMYWEPASTGANSGILAIGNTEGIVKVLSASLASDGAVVVSNFGTVWSQVDRIPVSQVAVTTLGGQAVLVAAKEMFIVAVGLDLAAGVVKPTTYCFMGAHASAVTGMHVCRSGLVVAASGDSVYQQIVPKMDEVAGGSDLQVEIGQLDFGSRAHTTSHGLTVSPNGVFVVFVESPAGPFDHLVLKEALKVHVATLATSVDDVGDVLLNRADGPLTHNLDALEYVRLHVMSGEPLPLPLQQLCCADLSEASQYTLKLVRYLLQLQTTTAVGDDDAERSLRTQVALLNNQIVCRRYEQTVLPLLAKPDVQSLLQMNHDLCTSLLLMATWWLQCNQAVADKSIAQCAFELCAVVMPDDSNVASWDVCAVCKEDVTLHSPTESLCNKGHKTARCCQTLLQTRKMDASSQRKCSLCGAMSIEPQPGANWGTLLDSYCSFCDGILYTGL
ncbi:PREDICTED: general transcription factor 3C polypeptide 4-like [Priapulus caudatus]|uniref:General transcription factor 3C polypeptide 4-like n=1 Tax=Priapulus caudatus TaxID=37621 RepID=A0ABM1EZL1_PRICU|nr:PREDICTED: general transcription factor 3C polypeptide 4-like [Priapulus caudatus]